MNVITIEPNHVFRVELPLGIIVDCLSTIQPSFPKLAQLSHLSRLGIGYRVSDEVHVLSDAGRKGTDSKHMTVSIERFSSSIKPPWGNKDVV